MSGERRYTTEHSRVVPGPVSTVYDLVADVVHWPVIFGPTMYVSHLGHNGNQERFRLWALVNDEVKTWTSRRTLDRAASRISFGQERSQPPVASMGGDWSFRPLPGGRTEVLLRHHFAAVDDDAGAVAWIQRALDRNSPAELDALARLVELGHPVDDVVFSFVDMVRMTCGAAAAYEFVNRADRWAERLPHVARVVLREDLPGVQHLEMDTVTAGGDTHTTASVRICQPPGLIAYKQLRPPTLLLGHSGSWVFAEDADGTVVTARHTVAVDPAMVREVLGADASLADARTYVRAALGANSRATLDHAAAFTAAGGIAR